ncbi:VWA domain-containing protein [Candidatus Kapabacteria bacterium]|nr:VWA domain-containing protein [Candidatus Kapabacteria bacterium]
MKKIILSLILMTNISLFSQSIEITNINIDNYPTIRAEVEATDAAGNQYSQFADEPIILTEDGVVKPIIFQECDSDVKKYSLIVVADISGSMELGIDGNEADEPFRRIDILQRSIKTLVQRMNPNRSEFSLHTFAGRNTVYIEFSQNRDSILTVLNREILTKSNTDFNAAFTGIETNKTEPTSIGAIPYAFENAKWKPVILFFSDGEHNKVTDFDVRTNEISALAKSQNPECIVFSAQFGGSTPGSIGTIVGDTGGTSYGSLTTEDDVERAFRDILDEVERNPTILSPCEIEWVTDCDQNLIKVDGTINGSPVSATATYNVPDIVKPSIEIDDRNPVVLNNGNSQIKLTARNSDITISGANFSELGFNFVEDISNLTLTQDVETVLNLTHTDNNLDCTPSNISFNSTACFGNDLVGSSGFLTTTDVSITGATPGIKSDLNAVCFNNNFCKDVTITNIRIENGDSGLFPFLFPGPTVVTQSTQALFDFSYFPLTPGNHSADLIITVDGVDYTAKINGSSSGLPEITANITQNAADVVCDETSELVIEITNPGSVPMSVTDITIDNLADFALKNGTVTNFQVAENNTETVSVTIVFDPQSEGTKNANVTIVNDTGNNSNLLIPITGKELDLDFQFVANSSEIDLGILCPNQLVDFTVEVENVGEANTILTLDNSQPEFTFADNNVFDFINAGSNSIIKNMSFDANGLSEGAFSFDLLLIDDCSSNQDFVTIKGIIEPATTQYDPSVYDYGSNNQIINIDSDLNTTTPITLTLINNYSKDITNIIASISGDPANVFAINVTNTDNSALAGETYQIEVEYTPKDVTNYTLNLEISAEVDGLLCLNETLISLQTDASVPTAEIQSQDVSALIDQNFQLTPSFVDNNNFFAAGITSVLVDVAVPTNLIESTDGVTSTVDGLNTLYRYEINLNNPQTLNFVALDPNDPAVNSDIIEFRFVDTNPSGRGFVNNNNINFNLLRATANIELNNQIKKPGELVTININSSDFVGVVPDFHKSISGQLKFNASLLKATGSTPNGTIEKQGEDYFRIIDFTIDLTGTGTQSAGRITTGITNTTLTLDFIALLGNAESTLIEVINPTSEVGQIDFGTINLGTFTLDPHCKDGDGNLLRLFDPFVGSSILTIEGNPATTTSLIKLNLVEDGYHKLSLVDLNGNILKNILNSELSHGKYEYNLNTNNLHNGVYLIMLKTPNEVYTEELIISN